MKDWILGPLLGMVAVLMVSGAMTGWYGPPVEVTLWSLIGILWVVIAVRLAERPWLAVAAAGAVSAIVAGIMQAAFLHVLVARNPAWAGFSVDAATRWQAFASALPIGLTWGALFGFIAWAWIRLQRRRTSQVEADAPAS